MKFPEETIQNMVQYRQLAENPAEQALEEKTEYTVEELALAANTSVRNIRAYQDKGLLPPPTLRGRKGIYSNQHLSRLRVIADLLDRGYTLASILDLISGLEQGVGLSEILGMESAINSPWAKEAPEVISMAQMIKLFGLQLTPAAIKLAGELGVATIQGTQVRVSSMSTLKVAADLCATGIPLIDQLEILRMSRDNVEKVAKEFVRLISENVLKPYEQKSLPPKEEFPKIIDLIWRMRPMAEIVVKAELGRAMDMAASSILADQLEGIMKSLETARHPSE
ncbi:MAG TPA: MerR family transcriptional regulator [Spongiibacteraceae bacterium]|nr:MerR family transcriptional regulator [Spongiibacteraceae bacterium]HCS27392.1 MerR family transcriptional regulator [Spongiibacteraceae bacterium]|tara:strand:+ start:2450 stop:3292 length:843 start_codon:yes stop_codon:yes gene_type:complete